MAVSILVFPGSVRIGSFNGKLADAAAQVLARMGAEVTRISLADYPLPIMDQNLENEKGLPENAMKLARLIGAHDGLFLACPEYNASVTPLMKNTVDWVSRVKSDNGRPFRPWKNRQVALGSASAGRFGGMRGLYHIRASLMAVGAQVMTEQCGVPGADKAFGEDGMFVDPRQAEILETACQSLIDHARIFSPREA